MDGVTPLLMPQVNVNDESVLLVRWSVAPHATVAAGDLVCEVETSKATSEVLCDRAGVLGQAAAVGTRIRIGEAIGAIGPSAAAVDAYLAARNTAARSGPAARNAISATPKARALAEQHGIALDTLADTVPGTIKESDVRQFLALRAPLQEAPNKYVDRDGPVPPFEGAVAASLRRSTSQLILTSVDMDCRLGAVHARLQTSLAAGRMASLLHAAIMAVARTLPAFPRLTSIVHDGAIFRYRDVDVAFVARNAEGHLYTPVVRGADRLDLDGIAKACQAATLRVMRHAVKAEELEGACFTISHVAVPGTTRVVALPNAGQSAILGVSAERTRLELQNGAAVSVPFVTLTLTYDHALCDGVYAATFLAALVALLEQPIA